MAAKQGVGLHDQEGVGQTPIRAGAGLPAIRSASPDDSKEASGSAFTDKREAMQKSQQGWHPALVEAEVKLRPQTRLIH